MIRVLVEIWNNGDPNDRGYIGEIRMGRDNDIPMSAEIGAYTIALHQKEQGRDSIETYKGRVENFNRKESDAFDLTKLALDALLKERSWSRRKREASGKTPA